MDVTWSWYLLLVAIIVLNILSLFTEDLKPTDYLGVLLGTLGITYVFVDYFDLLSFPDVPYMSMIIAAATMIYLVYVLMYEAKEPYFPSEDCEEDSGCKGLRDKASIVSTLHISKYHCVTPEDGSDYVDLDKYGKPANPYETGKAISKMFSNNATQGELFEALQAISEPEEANDDSDDSGTDAYIGFVIIFLLSAPFVYLSLMLLFDEMRKYGML